MFPALRKAGILDPMRAYRWGRAPAEIEGQGEEFVFIGHNGTVDWVYNVFCTSDLAGYGLQECGVAAVGSHNDYLFYTPVCCKLQNALSYSPLELQNGGTQ